MRSSNHYFFRMVIACSLASITTVANANPVMDTKTKIREAIEIWDGENCFGVCSLSRTFSICTLVNNLDRQVGCKITNKAVKSKSRLLSIDKSDLKLMQLISSQCKPFVGELPPALSKRDPTNSKSFEPACPALSKIRKGLGLDPSGGEHYRLSCGAKK
jgi:hypothetical protein